MLTDKTRGGIRESRWRDFADSVERLNTFVQPKALRRYQQDLLNADGFTVVSPLSGRRVTVRYGVTLRGRIAYLADDTRKFWLLTGPLQFGHPLSEVVSESDGTCRPISATPPWKGAPLRAADLERLRDVLGVADGDARPTILVGNPNFAHHIWNEMGGLEAWSQDARTDFPERVRILATAEPLGPLNLIFPKLATVNIAGRDARRPASDLKHLCRVVRPGSRIVTTNVRRAVNAFCDANVDEGAVAETRRLLGDARPRIWVSVRHKSRTPENQTEFLLTLFAGLFRSYPDAAVVLDGFSFPYGFFEDARAAGLLDTFASVAKDVGSSIDHIVGQARAALGQGVRIRSISGLSLADAIHIGSYCDYYVCHAGTLQHKIAWLHNIPGFVHMPTPSNARASWHSEQVEGGIVPDTLPLALVSPRVPSQKVLIPNRNFNYRIMDVGAASECVMAAMRSSLAI